VTEDLVFVSRSIARELKELLFAQLASMYATFPIEI